MLKPGQRRYSYIKVSGFLAILSFTRLYKISTVVLIYKLLLTLHNFRNTNQTYFRISSPCIPRFLRRRRQLMAFITRVQLNLVS